MILKVKAVTGLSY